MHRPAMRILCAALLLSTPLAEANEDYFEALTCSESPEAPRMRPVWARLESVMKVDDATGSLRIDGPITHGALCIQNIYIATFGMFGVFGEICGGDIDAFYRFSLSKTPDLTLSSEQIPGFISSYRSPTRGISFFKGKTSSDRPDPSSSQLSYVCSHLGSIPK